MASTIVDAVICSQCGVRDADVFIRRKVGPRPSATPDDSADLALCETCARSRGLVVGKGRLQLSLGEILGSVLSADGTDPAKGVPVDLASKAVAAVCPECGMDLSTLLREGRLGCAACVETFRPALRRFLSRHSSSGTVPAKPGRRASRNEGEADLASRLNDALGREDYETAALVRDRILEQKSSRGGGNPVQLNPVEPPVFPFGYPAFRRDAPLSDGASETDVVLWTVAVMSRNLVGIPFVGNPVATANPSRSLLAAAFATIGKLRTERMGSLPGTWRRSLSERALISRSRSADPEALLTVSGMDPLYLVVDEGEHLKLISRLVGFDPSRALSLVESYADEIRGALPEGHGFARDQEFGWITTRMENCGEGCSLGAVLHLPALVLTGMHERFLKSALAEGAVVRGLYSLEGDASGGSVYEIVCGSEDSRTGAAARDLLVALVNAAVRAERRARETLSSGSADALRDAVGRAYGILRYARRVEASEGVQLASKLRLASLVGLLKGVDARAFDSLLEELGPASLAREAGFETMPDRAQEDLLRARRLAAVAATATIAEGGY